MIINANVQCVVSTQFRAKKGSSDISSDERKKIDKKKKTAELVVYFNNH